MHFGEQERCGYGREPSRYAASSLGYSLRSPFGLRRASASFEIRRPANLLKTSKSPEDTQISWIHPWRVCCVQFRRVGGRRPSGRSNRVRFHRL